VVLLDSRLPTGKQLDARFVPPQGRLGRDDWKQALEEVDQEPEIPDRVAAEVGRSLG
jgi:hypothetical protein